MKFAQIFLPAILFAICKSQPYENRDSDEPLNVANNFFKNLDAQQKSEQLIEQYRFLIAKSLLRLKDACKVYDFLMGVDQKWFDGGGDKEEFPDSGVNEPQPDTEQYIRSVLNILGASKTTEVMSPLQHENATNPTINILFYFVTTSALLKDPELDEMLRNMLRDQCCAQPNEPGAVERNCGTAGIMKKREPPRKPRFHSWGGKRSREMPKIVIRTPFRPWGGKRSELNVPDYRRR